MGSAKLDRLVEYLEPLVEGQGAQVVVFTYFGPSMIPLIEEALIEKGLTVARNHGQMSDSDRKADWAAFKAGEKSIFLTSDAGARGINLPEALYVVEYDMALQHSLRVQRVNRIHRIDSKHPSVTFQTFIHKDTVEDGPITSLVNKRNKWSDVLLDYDVAEEEDFTSAELRKALMKRARERVLEQEQKGQDGKSQPSEAQSPLADANGL
jgi:superfamily II DNA/RNA helicase